MMFYIERADKEKLPDSLIGRQITERKYVIESPPGTGKKAMVTACCIEIDTLEDLVALSDKRFIEVTWDKDLKMPYGAENLPLLTILGAL